MLLLKYYYYKLFYFIKYILLLKLFIENNILYIIYKDMNMHMYIIYTLI